MLPAWISLSACNSVISIPWEPLSEQQSPWCTVRMAPRKLTTSPEELNNLLSGSRQVKLIDYIHRQRQCKLSVPLNDRTAELNSYPRFNDWLDIVNVRKEVVQVSPELPTLLRRCQLPAGFQLNSSMRFQARWECVGTQKDLLWKGCFPSPRRSVNAAGALKCSLPSVPSQG